MSAKRGVLATESARQVGREAERQGQGEAARRSRISLPGGGSMLAALAAVIAAATAAAEAPCQITGDGGQGLGPGSTRRQRSALLAVALATPWRELWRALERELWRALGGSRSSVGSVSNGLPRLHTTHFRRAAKGCVSCAVQ
jgi:hypothetical protein